ncbi:hypothetical protein, partial [Pseudomonas sp. FG-3G]
CSTPSHRFKPPAPRARLRLPGRTVFRLRSAFILGIGLATGAP